MNVSPEFGTREDLRSLADACHEKGIHLVLDGVFNHVSRRHPLLREAPAMFTADASSPGGMLCWWDVANLPELRWENPAVGAMICDGPDSVVRRYLREDGVDGWRLDVAYELGPRILKRITDAAHHEKPGSLVLGEIWSYPDAWTRGPDAPLDGLLNFHFRQLILHLLRRDMSGTQAGRLLAGVVKSTGIAPLLRSWIVLDNHDTPRLNTMLRRPWQRRVARLLQLTLPGSPCIYYGSELGMEGGDDPEMRAPMRWDLVNRENEELAWTRQLLRLRAETRALRVGDLRVLPTERLLCFMRYTDRVDETVLVVINPTAEAWTEVLPMPEARLMNDEVLYDGLGRAQTRVLSGMVHVRVPPRTARVFRPRIRRDRPGYSAYKRIR